MPPDYLSTTTRCSRGVCRVNYARGGGSSGAEVCDRSAITGVGTTPDGIRGAASVTDAALGRTLGAQAAMATHWGGTP